MRSVDLFWAFKLGRGLLGPGSHDFDMRSDTAQKSKEVVIVLKHHDGLPVTQPTKPYRLPSYHRLCFFV
jgi:hypothetical protein